MILINCCHHEQTFPRKNVLAFSSIKTIIEDHYTQIELQRTSTIDKRKTIEQT